MPVMDKVMETLGHLISDPGKLEEARQIARKCITEGNIIFI